MVHVYVSSEEELFVFVFQKSRYSGKHINFLLCWSTDHQPFQILQFCYIHVYVS